jgi:hypothetical protein
MHRAQRVSKGMTGRLIAWHRLTNPRRTTVADHTHSDYADGFDAGVEAGAQQFRDFLARYAPVYVKDIKQWHQDFLAARPAGVDSGDGRKE